MAPNTDIDALYESFCSGVPQEARDVARTLAFRLKLVPAPGIPWSEVFQHRVTLQAPALLAEGMPEAGVESKARAVLAHMLAVIEAFGTDRIMDRQTEDEPVLRDVLGFAREARNSALSALVGPEAVRAAERADKETLTAIATERSVLLQGEAVDFGAYERISAGKQAVGLPASLALAEAAGWDGPRRDSVRTTLMGVWLGLQFQDDVMDWEDDVTRGGAWAVSLARNTSGATFDGADLSGLRERVLPSGVLAEMLRLAFERFRTARVESEKLGAHELSVWLREREAQALDAHSLEVKSPGYFLRLRKLAPWAKEVLA
jgi:hypothetical protein